MATPSYTFVFLEIFSCEGGIQSYVKDILSAYCLQSGAPPADIYLLRDGVHCENSLEGGPLRFHYFASRWALVSRVRLAAALFFNLARRRPLRVICGHINLAPLIHQLCSRLGLPYTVMTYGKEVWRRLPAHQRRALQQADSIWTISRYSQRLACAANDTPMEKVQILPCVVNGDRFKPGDPDPQLLEQYGLQGHAVLMTVARLWSGDIYKGVDVTIRAMPAIAQAIPNVKYLVIGRGDDQPRLAHLADERKVADRVIFAGFVPTAELAAHYRLANAYVMPSQEGFGIVYLEAMACGVPVLAGNSDGSADPLQDGRLGWQVPHRDPDAVAAACIEMLRGQSPRCNGDWLRQETLAKFGPQALIRRVSELLQLAPVEAKTSATM